MKQNILHICLAFLTLLLINFSANAQKFVPNYDESKVPSYQLPELLICNDGTPVKTAKEWTEKRRPEVFALFEEHVYGKTPDKSFPFEFDVETQNNALNGKAIFKWVSLYPFGKSAGFKMDVLIYLPKNAHKPVPAFLGLSLIDKVKPQNIPVPNQNVVEMVISRGYGFATAYNFDIDPDEDDGFQNGVHPFFYPNKDYKLKPNEWGSIGAWAWGLSRVLDYCEQDKQIDASKVAVLGHSRLGKTALWVGASDERFAIVISNDSGCGGAALSKRCFGETVGRINRAFPHWFNDNFNQYNENESALPVDQHMLIALMAPRPVYVASAEDDRWADQKGEFLSAKYAGEVYELFGKQGVGVDEMPAVNHPVGDFVRYHIRKGQHDLTEYDWRQYLDFADRHFDQ